MQTRFLHQISSFIWLHLIYKPCRSEKICCEMWTFKVVFFLITKPVVRFFMHITIICSKFSMRFTIFDNKYNQVSYHEPHHKGPTQYSVLKISEPLHALMSDCVNRWIKIRQTRLLEFNFFYLTITPSWQLSLLDQSCLLLLFWSTEMWCMLEMKCLGTVRSIVCITATFTQ